MNLQKTFLAVRRRLRRGGGLVVSPIFPPGTARVARAVTITVTILLFVCHPVPALAAVGTVDGVIKDALQRPIAGAQLRLESGAGQVVGRTITDDQGRFAFTGIAAGTYVVVAEKTGFEAATAVVTVTETAGASTDLTMASVKPLDVNVALKKLEEARIEIQPRIGASTYSITKEGDSGPAGRRQQLDHPGDPPGSRSEPGLGASGLLPRPQRARERAVPDQRGGAARRRQPLRAERGPEPAPGEFHRSHHRIAARPSSASTRPASSTCRPRAGPSIRAGTSACTEAATRGSTPARSIGAGRTVQLLRGG